MGTYYPPPPPFLGGKQPLAPARLHPSVMDVPPPGPPEVDNPPFGRLEAVWTLDHSTIQGRPYPCFFVRRGGDSFASLDQPPFRYRTRGSTGDLQSILDWWVPPPWPAQSARVLPGDLAAVPVNTAVGGRSGINRILESWIPSPPLPQLPRVLPGDLAGSIVNNPPFGPLQPFYGILASWIPQPGLPILPLRSAPFISPRVDRPIPFQQGGLQNVLAQWAVQNWEVVNYSLLIDNLNAPPPVSPMAVAYPSIRASWDQQGWLLQPARYLPASVTAVEVDNPPFGTVTPLYGILVWWIPGPGQPTQARLLNPFLIAVEVDNPPFGYPPPWIWGVLPQWQPGPPPAQGFQQLVSPGPIVINLIPPTQDLSIQMGLHLHGGMA